MTLRRSTSSWPVLFAGSAACVVSPFLFWVGRGECGWTCYSPVGAGEIAGPSRLDDLHIGWHVAVAPSCALALLGVAVLAGLLLQRKTSVGTRALWVASGAAVGVAVWASVTALQRGASPGLEKGGFVGAAGAAAIACVLLVGLIAPLLESRRASGTISGSMASADG